MDLKDLIAAIERITRVDASVAVLVQSLAAQVAALAKQLGNADSAATQSIAAQMAGLGSAMANSAGELASAVVANTEPPPAPVSLPVVEEPVSDGKAETA